MTGLIIANYILENEHYPFRYMHLKKLVLSDQFPDYLVDCIVQFYELISLIMLVRKYLLFDVHLHVK